MFQPVLDFGSHSAYAVALLPEILLAVVAMFILLLEAFRLRRSNGRSGRWTGGMALLAVLAAGGANTALIGAQVLGGPGAVSVDGFQTFATFVILGAAAVAILFSGDYLEREDLQTGEFYALLLLATVGMMLLAVARDLMLLFVSLELMSISVYVLTGIDRKRAASSEAALKYFLMGAFASAFLLYGIALVYGATGSTNLTAAREALGLAVGRDSVLLRAGVGLLLVGFGFKVAAVPFHMWTPDAYEGAPTPVTGLMATGVKAAAFVALIRVIVVDLGPAATTWRPILWWLAMLTMIVPNLVALAQDRVKRMLAYSSVAHAGYLLVGVTAGSALGMSAALFYLAVYTLMTLGAFGIVYYVEGQGDRHGRLADFRALGWRHPVAGLALVVFLLSLAGFPPTGGFVGKLYLLRAAVDSGQLALALTLVLTSLVSYSYYFRVIWKMYFEATLPEAPELESPRTEFRLATGLCMLGVLGLGFAPGPLLRSVSGVGLELGTPSAVIRTDIRDIADHSNPGSGGAAARPATSEFEATPGSPGR
ncbi:MAG: NADH-quinone oxidoreductase subunit N [Gemmatimonadota bacterium]